MATLGALPEPTPLTRDGLSLYLCCYPHTSPADHPASHLFFLPGYGDHVGRYQALFTHLRQQGIEVWAMDPRGHGQSQGARGVIHRFADSTGDLAAGLAMAQQTAGGDRWTVLAHSTGGLVVLSLMIDGQLPGWVQQVAVTSPLLGLNLKGSPVKRLLGRLLSRVWPTLCIAPGGPRYQNSHDPEAQRLRATDPLMFRKVNVRWFTEVCAQMARMAHHAGRLPVPVLVMQAGQDKVVNPQATAAFCDRHEPVTLVEFADMYHEILLEQDKQAVFAALDRWLAQGADVDIKSAAGI